MQKSEIALSIDGEKLDALEYYLKKENATVQKRMNEALMELYERTVPDAVREFLDRKHQRCPSPGVPHGPARKSPRRVRPGRRARLFLRRMVMSHEKQGSFCVAG